MSDQPKEHNPFKPTDPTIPGVTGNRARSKPAPQPPRVVLPQSSRPVAPRLSSAVSPQMWMGAVAIVIVIIALGMYSKRRPALVSEVRTAPIPDPADLPPGKPAQATANLPLGPGPIATTAELSKTWSSKRFFFALRKRRMMFRRWW